MLVSVCDFMVVSSNSSQMLKPSGEAQRARQLDGGASSCKMKGIYLMKDL